MGVWIEITKFTCQFAVFFVAPFVGVWIEMLTTVSDTTPEDFVAPFVGVWIEILLNSAGDPHMKTSLPSWECGLKSVTNSQANSIEVSLPSWECGLKFRIN